MALPGDTYDPWREGKSTNIPMRSAQTHRYG